MIRRAPRQLELATRVESLEDRSLLSAVPFADHTIVDLSHGADRADAAVAVVAADINGDGRVDVVSASFNDDKIVWYKNTAGSGIESTPRTIGDTADGPLSVYVSDVDGDGDLDVLAASWFDDTIAWYENDGAALPEFTVHTIATDADGGRSVFAADIDGDNDIDVLSASLGDDKIVWYENTAGDGSEFIAHIIATDADQAFSVFAADVDGDGDVDVLSASRGDDKIAWYENTAGDGSAFTMHVVSTTVGEANSVYAADLDNDNDLDILAAAHQDGTILWFENTAGDGSAFTEHVISTTAAGAFSVVAGDVDGDGDLDVLSASRADDEIAWYENTAGNASAFTMHRITADADGAQSVATADLDDDGDLDVLSASFNDDKIAWYENSPAVLGPAPTADVADISPDPRSTAVGTVSVLFTQDVSGVDVGDFRLTRNGTNVALTGISVTQVTASQYTLNLSSITTPAGSYELRLLSAGTGIVNAGGQSLTADAVDSWVTSLGQPTLTAPTGTTSDTTPTITWTAVAGADHYDLQVNSVNSGGIEVIRQSSLSGTSFTPSTPLPAGTYQAFVRAFDINGQAGPWSPGLTFTVAGLPTADIVDISPDPRSTPVGVVTVFFSENVTGVDVGDFRLTRDGSQIGLGGVAVTPVSGSQYLLDLTSLTAVAGTYELRLVAAGSGIVGSSGVALAGDAVDTWLTLGSLPLLTAPTGTVSDTTPTFTWNPVVDANHYELRVNNVTTGNNDVIHELNLTGTAFTPSTPLPPGAYQAWLRSFNASGQPGPWSDPLQFTISAAPTADVVDVTPDPRTTAVGTVTILFSETVTGVDVSDFRLTRDGSQVDLSGLAVGQVSGSEYRLNLFTRTGGTGLYELTLRSNGSGITDTTGDPLTADAIDTWDTVIPLPVLTGPIGSTTDATPTFTWQAVLNVNHYELRVNSTTSGNSEVLRQDNLTTTSFTPTSPLPTGTYQAWLRVFNSSGQPGSWSVPIVFTVEAVTLADIADVTPDPRTSPVGDATVTFTRDVTGVDVGDFRLTRDGSNIDLAGIAITETNPSEYSLDLSSVTGGTGVYELRLIASGSGIVDTGGEPLIGDAVELWQTVPNTPPVLADIDDQFISYAQDTHSITLPANDVDGDTLTYTAEIGLASSVEELAYQLDQQLGLFDYTGGHYWFDYFGLQEKWMEGTGREYYYITPDGSLYDFKKTIGASLRLGTLSGDYHANPALLHDAQLPDPSDTAATASFNGNTLTLDPADGFLGEFEVHVTVSDGQASDSRSFMVRVTNSAPVLATIGGRLISHTADVLDINLAASDADGDPLSYSVEVDLSDPLAQLAFDVDQQFGLFDYTGGHYWVDFFGLGEKWMEGTDGEYYYVTPDGSLYHYTGNISTSPRVATLDSSYYADPVTLHNAQPPGAGNGSVSASISGNTLTLDPADGFADTFRVTVEVSDGVNIDRETFQVGITNLPPELDPIDDQVMSPGDVLQLTLQASDPDSASLIFSAEVLLADPLSALAYNLDQQLGLFDYTGGHYWLDYFGLGEKWMEAADGEYYYVTPDGSLYVYAGSIDSNVRIITLSSDYHANPQLLHDALPPDTAPTDVTATVAGNVLTIGPAAGYIGEFLVSVEVSDGVSTDTSGFIVQVSEAAAVLANLGDQTISPGEESLVINLNSSGPGGSPVTFSAQLLPDDVLSQLAFDLDSELGLFDYTTGHYWLDYFGLGEKWMEGFDGEYYYITLDGKLYHYTGSTASSQLIATLDETYHADPSLLHEASTQQSAGSRSAGTVTILGNQLILTPADGFTGELRLAITATIDGQSATKTIRVVVAGV